MTFISLRKQQPDPAPEDADATVLEDQEDSSEPQTSTEDEQPTSIPGAIAAGVRGWLTWCSTRIGAGWTYALHLVAIWAACHYSAWVTWCIVIGLAVAINLFIPHEPLERLVARIEGLGRNKPAGSPGEDSQQPPTDPLPALMWRLIADAPGVHLKTLTHVLGQAAEEEGTEAPSKAAVEQALTTRGIPLRDSVRDTRNKVNRGVHREDLAAWATAPPPTPRDAPAAGP